MGSTIDFSPSPLLGKITSQAADIESQLTGFRWNYTDGTPKDAIEFLDKTGEQIVGLLQKVVQAQMFFETVHSFWEYPEPETKLIKCNNPKCNNFLGEHSMASGFCGYCDHEDEDDGRLHCPNCGEKVGTVGIGAHRAFLTLKCMHCMVELPQAPIWQYAPEDEKDDFGKTDDFNPFIDTPVPGPDYDSKKVNCSNCGNAIDTYALPCPFCEVSEPSIP